MAAELSLSAQTMFAQVVDAARAINLSRSVADLSGHFASRTIKGRKYWYFRYRDLGNVERMAYVGPDSDELRALIQESKQPSAVPGLRRLAQAAIDLGASSVPGHQFKVIDRLAQFGFFRAGGVLIGTHAFMSYGNMFGIRWVSGDRTQDVDFAHAGRNLAIALPADIPIDTHGAIESLEQGFIPTMRLSGKAGATYRHPTDAAFQLDFLTTLHRGGDKPFEHRALGIVLQPLRFLEYLLEGVTETAIISDLGAVMVSVPAPARYAIHKLIIADERIGGASSPKRGKDIEQAREIFVYLRAVRPESLEKAWSSAVERGHGWAKRARTGLAALDRLAPGLGARQWLDGATRKPATTRPKSKAKVAAAKRPAMKPPRRAGSRP
jgi:hypothetical protein